jgi:hypothetical protein
MGAALHAHVITQIYSQMEHIPPLVLVMRGRRAIMILIVLHGLVVNFAGKASVTFIFILN